MSPSARASADMKKQKSPGFARLLVYVVLIGGMAESCNDMLREIFFRGIPTISRLEYYWRTRPEQFVLCAVYLLLILMALRTFLKMIFGGGKAASPAPKRAVPVQKKTAAPSHRDAEAEEAIHCAHLTGRAKYLEQIENYLRTGLIDREEYKVLKARYMSIDIPDDYH